MIGAKIAHVKCWCLLVCQLQTLCEHLPVFIWRVLGKEFLIPAPVIIRSDQNTVITAGQVRGGGVDGGVSPGHARTTSPKTS